MHDGLESATVKNLLLQYGYNEIPEAKVSLGKKLLKKLYSPISFMLVAAAILSLVLGKLFDCCFIIVLLLINVAIAIWQENKADTAIKKLNEQLAQQVKTLRDDSWQSIPARELVPGDVIQLGIGEIIPADGTIIEAHHVTVNESAVSGESLPKEKNPDDAVYSGSFIASGQATMRITATGQHTSFGKTIFSVERVRKKSILELDILSISKFLTIFSLLAVLLLTIVFLLQRASVLEVITLDLSLVIAGIPISLPTVMTLIIEFGVIALAKKQAIVRRLSSLEDLANVNFLLTDKTGTLTQNKITVQQIQPYGCFTEADVVRYAAIVAAKETDNPIDAAILQKAESLGIEKLPATVVDFQPADSDRKRSTLVIANATDTTVLSVGAPQVVASYCQTDAQTAQRFQADVARLATEGYRTVAVAMAKHKEEQALTLIGLLSLSDTLRPDAKDVISFLQSRAIDVAMVTGDNREIAAQIAHQLALHNGTVVPKDSLHAMDWQHIDQSLFNSTAAFAEILPEDKLNLVLKAKEFFVVAANGDGINDLPAIKAANVGFAVKNAVSAVKATADIVLLTDGIKVIGDAILESRQIFARLYTYSLYRISESLRLIITITVLGILYRVYPLTTLQIIVLALLNDIPIISLATDRVKITSRPAKINAKKRFTLSSMYGFAGILNSLILFFIIRNIMHLDWATIQTIYFLKLTVSGHMLIYVAHTKERWFKFLPSKGVIIATSLTQLFASLLAFSGFLMPTHISLVTILGIWAWSFLWMQVSELAKMLQQHSLESRGST